MKGKLVVFEGLDGCGKSTQAELLVAALVKSGRKSRLIHFPAYQSATGRLIAEHLRGERKAGPSEMALLYALDKYEEAPFILELLAQGYFLVVDRYTASNAAYQPAREPDAKRRKELTKWILSLERSLPKADFTLLIDVAPRLAFKNNLRKRGRSYLAGKRDAYEKDLAFQARVRAQYLLLAKNKLLAVVKADRDGKMLPKEQVHATVMRVLGLLPASRARRH